MGLTTGKVLILVQPFTPGAIRASLPTNRPKCRCGPVEFPVLPNRTDAVTLFYLLTRSQSRSRQQVHIKGACVFARHICGGIVMVNCNAVTHSCHPIARSRMRIVLNERNHTICKCVDTMVCMLVADINSQILFFLCLICRLAPRQVLF